MSTRQRRQFVAIPPNWLEMTEEQQLAWASEFMVTILGEDGGTFGGPEA